ncbi:MAG: membrane protein insertion efficiency factor YidD, partial [Cystobacterineae bacterium]|nr:membrane protein insertion efficiency factor YidD [Cystobacterineae bacterium]
MKAQLQHLAGPLRRLAVLLLKTPILAYRTLLSPLLGPHCRFYPSCSTYALSALQQHGPLQGSLLSLRRLLRCHPFHPGGFDAVPPTKLSRTPAC